MPAALKFLLRSPLPAIFLVALLALAEYQNNIGLVYPREVLIPLACAVIIGLVAYYLYRFIMPAASRLATLLASLMAAAVLYRFDDWLAGFSGALAFISIQLPDLLTLGLFMGVLAGAIGLLALAVERYLPRIKLSVANVAQFLVIMVTAAFLYSAVTVSAKLTALWPQLTPVAQKSLAPSHAPAAKPDIYYLVLEDYASAGTLKDIYHYDNSPFLDALTGQGFTVNSQAFSNYPYTADSIPSTLQMDYLTNVADKFKPVTASDLPLRQIFDHPPVTAELKKASYQYLQLGSWWTDTRNIPAADVNYTAPFQLHLFGRDITLSEYEINVLDHSFFGRLFNVNNSGAYDIANYQLSTLHQLAQAQAAAPRFIFGHIILPHGPYVFNPDGSRSTYGQFGDEPGFTEEQKYINQLRYINTQISSVIADIKAKSSTPPVIILQSDEGPHPSEMEGEDELGGYNLNTLPDLKLRQKYGTLAAYYLPNAPGAAASITSPVNAFRVVLNQYLGYDLPLLPACSYAMRAPYTVYNFVDITARLTGAPADPRCSQVHK